ncbi:MAG: signal peptidase I [Deferrisomatales bacterium]
MSGAFTERKRRSYLWGGAVLLTLGAVFAVLNVALEVPEYQRISWVLVGFFLGSGVLAVGVAKGALPHTGKLPEYGEALVVAIVLAVLIRGGLVQAFKIPSGSMLPTLQIGDHLLVSKFLYGVRIPYTSTRVFPLRAPERGDIVVFAYPVDDSKDFIKRILGVPGDLVEIRNKRVFINGEAIDDPWGVHVDPAVYPSGYEEGRRDNFGPVVVPPDHYFTIGDNRDRSYDSRFWGFVEGARIRGKAFVLYWSWDSERLRPRLDRLGNLVR